MKSNISSPYGLPHRNIASLIGAARSPRPLLPFATLLDLSPGTLTVVAPTAGSYDLRILFAFLLYRLAVKNKVLAENRLHGFGIRGLCFPPSGTSRLEASFFLYSFASDADSS